MQPASLLRQLEMLAVIVLVAFLASACSAPPPSQPPSPLPPAISGELSDTVWQLETATYQGEPVEFDALAPIQLHFEQSGYLGVRSPHCPGGGWQIHFGDEHQYQLTGGMWAASDCGELRNTQFSDVGKALAATNTYELDGDQLILSGEDARLVLVSTDTAPAHDVYTRIPELDELTHIILTRDQAALLEHIHLLDTHCTHQEGLGGPPPCAEGQAEGTPVQVLPIIASHGYYIPKEDLDELKIDVHALYAAYRMPEGSTRYGEDWPRADYGLIFENTGTVPWNITVAVKDGQIVWIANNLGQTPEEALRRSGGEVLFVVVDDPYPAPVQSPVATPAPQTSTPQTAPGIKRHSWSPDGSVLAYWTFTAQEVAESYLYPPGALHFLDTRTGQSCAYPHPVAYGYFDSPIAWTPDSQILTLADDGQARLSQPCADTAQIVTDWFPAPPYSTPSQSQDHGQLLISSEQGYGLFDWAARTLYPIDGVYPWMENGYSWSPDGEHLAINAMERFTDHIAVQLYSVAAEDGATTKLLAGRQRNGLGSVGGPDWISTTHMLIPQTLDQGPLLVTLGDEFGLQPVVPELFHTTLNDGQTALATPADAHGVYHIVLTDWGSDGTMSSPIRVYHSDTGAVEQLPFHNAFSLSPDGQWILLNSPTDPQQPRCIALKSLASAAPATCLAPGAEWLAAAWSPDSTQLALAYPDTVTVYMVAGDQLYASQPTGSPPATDILWSPDGRTLAVTSHDTEAGDTLSIVTSPFSHD